MCEKKKEKCEKKSNKKCVKNDEKSEKKNQGNMCEKPIKNPSWGDGYVSFAT